MGDVMKWYDGMDTLPNAFQHQATWYPPNEKHHNLAFNSLLHILCLET